jgi:hypothetical protein
VITAGIRFRSSSRYASHFSGSRLAKWDESRAWFGNHRLERLQRRISVRDGEILRLPFPVCPSLIRRMTGVEETVGARSSSNYGVLGRDRCEKRLRTPCACAVSTSTRCANHVPPVAIAAPRLLRRPPLCANHRVSVRIHIRRKRDKPRSLRTHDSKQRLVQTGLRNKELSNRFYGSVQTMDCDQPGTRPTKGSMPAMIPMPTEADM